ncbi:hypothetical protein IB223_00030 [Pseudoxanthomonas sp. PXM03]|uniref:hypothetical protein n=1 Tax=Pseudoxanthomonas sp. PXM03 TaxID=2769284 RepID=UPI001784EA2A|nr:hypothetical protein [Pseudoxanthomonas sp. PXM03]MBD9434472.1 hypothetical protein [Pseudoxanthomonas sp. PXM03]
MMKIAAIVLFLCLLPGRSIAQDVPAPADRLDTARLAVSNYAECSRAIMGLLAISADECARRVELARTECLSKIQSGLPERLNDREMFVLGNRALACYMTHRNGKPYSNHEFDSVIEAQWEAMYPPGVGWKFTQTEPASHDS